MDTITATIEAAGVSTILVLRPGQKLTYSATETDFVGIAFFERSITAGASWETIETSTDASMTGGTVSNYSLTDVWYRFRAIDTDGETPITGSLAVAATKVSQALQEIKSPDGVVVLRITEEGVETPKLTPDSVVRTAQKRVMTVGAKVGATAGWTVGDAADTSLTLCPASQTAATLVFPVTGLKVGDTITGFHLIGQIESAGGTVLVDAALRKHTAAAADVSDASVGAITQVEVVADTIMSATNTRKASLTEVVAADETFYVLITATTAASTDIALQGVAIEFSEA